MDTKSKRISDSPIKKGLAFIIVLLSFAVFATMFVNLSRNTDGLEPLLEPSYLNTNELFNYQHNFYVGLDNLLKFKNEEYIKQGNSIDKEEFENRKKEVFYRWYRQININEDERIEGDSLYKLLKARFETENAEEINDIYNRMINEQLRSYYSLLQKVNKKEGLYYYATNGRDIYTNTDQVGREYFESFKANYLIDKDGLKVSPSEEKSMHISKMPESDFSIDSKIYIAVSDDYLASKQADWSSQNLYLKKGIAIILSAALLLLIALVYLMWKAGRKENDEKVHLIAIDNIYTDITTALIFGVIIIWAVIHSEIINSNHFNFIITGFTITNPSFWAVILINIICSGICLTLFLSLIRHFKNKTLIKHSLLYAIYGKIKSVIISIFKTFAKMIKIMLNSGPLSLRTAIIIIAGELAVFTLTTLIISVQSAFALFWVIILGMVSVGAIYYVILRIKKFDDIVKGVREIKNGKLDYTIEIKGDDELSKLAGDINDIADGLKNAVDKEIKAERMKTELITNVSHDLKTPLTSIINYADLLSKEKLVPDVANDYVAVLKQKSEKLRLLTQDLFEISKVQSGNISIDLEKIDISVLLKQSLAEFEEQISKSELDFKVNILDKDTFIMADGKRLSRVFENLIGNILKYTLAGTRVYVDVFTDKDNVFIEFKNIANYEMNFREDEILERFIRGDKSRSTEGNGLGLAIAQSYVVACGGSLEITIDGDLFKAGIKFKKSKDE